MAELIRIQKLLSDWGIASRRKIEEFIAAGRVTINEQPLTEPGFKIDPNNLPIIKIDGKQIFKKRKSFSIYAFHKPVDVLTTLKDEFGRKTIKEFLPKGKRLYPVGRLDLKSSGILIITDDGELTNRLLHPSYKVEKEYVVRIFGSSLTGPEKENFRKGVKLDDGMTAPCKIFQKKDPQTYTIILKEGRKRQIRKMFEKLERKVELLHRIRFGPVYLGNMKPGELRPLTKRETADLMKAVQLQKDRRDLKPAKAGEAKKPLADKDKSAPKKNAPLKKPTSKGTTKSGKPGKSVKPDKNFKNKKTVKKKSHKS
jgi:pseudouridine synthase